MLGAAKNHQGCISSLHQGIWGIINSKLRKLNSIWQSDYTNPSSFLEVITGDLSVKMQWAQYHQNIIFCYQVAIDAWPKDIPFANLSNVSSSLSQLELLLQKWKSGTIHWKKLSDEEDKELQQKMDREIENGDIEERPRHMHSDKGKKHKRHSSDNNPPSWKKYKSAEIIEDEDEGSGTPHEGPAISTDDNPTSGTSTM